MASRDFFESKFQCMYRMLNPSRWVVVALWADQAGGETVMAPGNLVISTYVTCPDITLTVTPDLKV